MDIFFQDYPEIKNLWILAKVTPQKTSEISSSSGMMVKHNLDELISMSGARNSTTV
jgi:hypothetical protein